MTGSQANFDDRWLQVPCLRGFPACLVLIGRTLPPVRHVATIAAVKLLWNTVVTSWARTEIILFDIH